MRRDKLDDLYSEFIRRRAIAEKGGCERCGTQKHDIQKDNGDIFEAYKLLDCAHCHGRAAKGVRWDPDNAAGLCGGCHMFLDAQAEAKREFFIKKLGQEAYDMPLARKRIPAKYLDREAIEFYLRQEIKRLRSSRKVLL